MLRRKWRMSPLLRRGGHVTGRCRHPALPCASGLGRVRQQNSVVLQESERVLLKTLGPVRSWWRFWTLGLSSNSASKAVRGWLAGVGASAFASSLAHVSKPLWRDRQWQVASRGVAASHHLHAAGGGRADYELTGTPLNASGRLVSRTDCIYHSARVGYLDEAKPKLAVPRQLSLPV